MTGTDLYPTVFLPDVAFDTPDEKLSGSSETLSNPVGFGRISSSRTWTALLIRCAYDDHSLTHRCRELRHNPPRWACDHSRRRLAP